jgi:hypothetical protein
MHLLRFIDNDNHRRIVLLVMFILALILRIGLTYNEIWYKWHGWVG